MTDPVFETERLKLHNVTVDDADFMLRLLNEPSFIENIGDRSVRTPDEARAYLRRSPNAGQDDPGHGLYRIDLKADGTSVGICSFLKRDSLDASDIGFALFPEYCSNGYAFEAASVVMEHAKNRPGLTRIVGITSPGNTSSIRVLEKLCLRFERMVRLSENEPSIMLFAWNDSA